MKDEKVEDDAVEKEEDKNIKEDTVEEDDDKDDNVAEDEVEDDDVEDADVKGEEDDVNVEEEEDDDVEEDDVEEEDRSQDREAHFVRACAGDMRMDISQEAFCAEIYRENAVRVSRDQWCGHTVWGTHQKLMIYNPSSQETKSNKVRTCF